MKTGHHPNNFSSWKQITRREYLNFVLYLDVTRMWQVFPKRELGNGLRGGVRVPLEHAHMGLFSFDLVN